MSKDIVFSHSTAKGCWVSEEIAQASMAYIQVTRKEPGFLRVYTYAEGQRPVLAHVTQQANAVVFADYQPADVRLLVESETEVVSAVVCQDSTGASGGDTYTKTEADSRFQLKGDYATNSSVDTKLADYATTASVNTELDKKADKAKAFTTDTVSTAPGQFVAGPATTQGNLHLRKIDISDIPDLKSKYQPINGNGIQEGPRAVGLSLGYRAKIGYLKALISASDTTSQVSPDWYYATDGTLQDIKVKAPKVVLDDAASTTSDNGVKNSVITKYVDGKVTTINSSITDLHTSLESTQTDFVDLRNKVNAMPKTVFITQAAYNALTTKDANTIYYING